MLLDAFRLAGVSEGHSSSLLCSFHYADVLHVLSYGELLVTFVLGGGTYT